MPETWQECVGEAVAAEVSKHWDELEEWHQGRRKRRPAAQSWCCSSFAEPWRQHLMAGHVLDFRGGRGAWLPREGLAKAPSLGLEAWADYFPADLYPHRRAVAYAARGVDYRAPLAPVLTIAPNLHSMYETRGGVEAVATEFHKHAEAGFREISVGRTIPFLPFRCPPCGCAERRDDPGRPRVLNDEGFPHDVHTTRDTGVPVEARNAKAGPMRPDPGDPRPKWCKEAKPRIGDAAHNAAIVAYMAHLVGEVGLTFVFDFKYFFHQFVLSTHELWASGALVPERLPDGSVSKHLRCVVTMVMAMGVAPASNVAQDVANLSLIHI